MKTPISPIEHSNVHSQKKSGVSSKLEKKKLGQFFTPQQIAIFMASMFNFNKENSSLKILDPGCGTLILSSAIIEKIIKEHNYIKEIFIYGFDIDDSLKEENEKTIIEIKKWGKKNNLKIFFYIKYEDFIYHKFNKQKFDLIISNPPYFKIKKSDPRIKLFDLELLGQQNIYSLFIIKSIQVLSESGQIIFITPRSFTSGLYFHTLRIEILKKLDINQFHVFHSRKSSFVKDKVLQENIIFHANKKSIPFSKKILISQTEGKNDLNRIKKKSYSNSQIIRQLGNMKIFHLPLKEDEEEAINIFKNWSVFLSDLNLRVSTGPVVAYRSNSHIPQRKTIDSVPLLWLHNCQRFKTVWPLKLKKKSQWIKINNISDSRTIKKQNYVLIRRTASKNDTHLITASPLISNDFEQNEIGIENHLNFIHKTDGEMPTNIAIGLSAFYNSRLFESFYKTICSSTQVNATDLNNIPIPEINLIREIGDEIIDKNLTDEKSIDLFLINLFNKSTLIYG